MRDFIFVSIFVEVEMAARLMFAVVAVLGFVAVSEAIRCEVCTQTSSAGVTAGNDGCLETFGGNDYTQDCGDSVNYCSKTVAKYSVLTISTEYTARACGGCSAVGESSTSYLGNGATTYCCDSDGCNGAGALMPALTLLLAALSLKVLW